MNKLRRKGIRPVPPCLKEFYVKKLSINEVMTISGIYRYVVYQKGFFFKDKQVYSKDLRGYFTEEQIIKRYIDVKYGRYNE